MNITVSLVFDEFLRSEVDKSVANTFVATPKVEAVKRIRASGIESVSRLKTAKDFVEGNLTISVNETEFAIIENIIPQKYLIITNRFREEAIKEPVESSPFEDIINASVWYDKLSSTEKKYLDILIDIKNRK